MRISFFKAHNITELTAEGTTGSRMKCFKEVTEVLTPILQFEWPAVRIFCPSQQKPGLSFPVCLNFMGLARKQASAYRSVMLHTSCLIYIHIQKTLRVSLCGTTKCQMKASLPQSIQYGWRAHKPSYCFN